MSSSIASEFPAVMSLLEGPQLNKCLELADGLVASNDGIALLADALKNHKFDLNELMEVLCAHPHFGFSSLEGRELEDGLGILHRVLDSNKVRKAFRRKLLSRRSKNDLQDVIHEIAIAGRAAKFLDPGTLNIETPVPGTPCNSDVSGKFGVNVVRIETTVLHEKAPVVIDLDWIDLVKSAHVGTGFSVTVRDFLTSRQLAENLKLQIERLYEQHKPNSEVDISIGDERFRWAQGAYQSETDASIIDSIEFDLPQDTRDVISPCTTRRITPKHVEDDYPTPPGIVSWTPEGKNHNDNTLSGKVRQRLAEKLEQCEDGAINIVALCPIAFGDRDVEDALFGAVSVLTSMENNELEVSKPHDKPYCSRCKGGPFYPRLLLSLDERKQFTNAFEKVSAVWVFRMLCASDRKLFLNPNATIPVPGELASAILGAK